mmetsp:Transcript_36522/g.67543  ORF Transcript_36522/g.67543 Transcript_36522/m.67543 type:complete len:92 (-) Transcript_36522:107-382(-)
MHSAVAADTSSSSSVNVANVRVQEPEVFAAEGLATLAATIERPRELRSAMFIFQQRMRSTSASKRRSGKIGGNAGSTTLLTNCTLRSEKAK